MEDCKPKILPADVIHFTSHQTAKSFEIGCFWQSKGKRKLRSASCALVQGIPLSADKCAGSAEIHFCHIQ
jgi:hypothetical protein